MQITKDLFMQFVDAVGMLAQTRAADRAELDKAKADAQAAIDQSNLADVLTDEESARVAAALDLIASSTPAGDAGSVAPAPASAPVPPPTTMQPVVTAPPAAPASDVTTVPAATADQPSVTGDGSTQAQRDEAATLLSTGFPTGNAGTEASRGTSG